MRETDLFFQNTTDGRFAAAHEADKHNVVYRFRSVWAVVFHSDTLDGNTADAIAEDEKMTHLSARKIHHDTRYLASI